MAVTTFAAIDVGSYDVSIKIYEISRKYGLHVVNELRSRLELGKDIFVDRKIGCELVEKLCVVLSDFKTVMQEYQVQEYRACATSSLQEAENIWLTLEQIYQRTGMQVTILSNSEQRFLGYKSIASKELAFSKIIQKGTAIIEVGGGSFQVSLFDKDALVTTQNFKLGNLRIRQKLLVVERETVYYERLVKELIHNEVLNFNRLHLKERKISNVILLGDSFIDAVFQNSTINKESFLEVYEKVVHHSPEEVAVEFGIPLEYASLLVPSIIIYKVFIDEFGAETMWIPGTQMTDGLAYEYGESHKIIKTNHNFENDIIEAAKNIGKRYASSKSQNQEMSKIALTIFDSMKKVHGMSTRERLLLQIAVLLHDCGKYISLSNVGACSYHIIMSTEIIGLSHAEREMIANIVRFNTTAYVYYEEKRENGINLANYMVIAKLTAILRLANALDRTHLQKVEDLSVIVRDKKLILSVATAADFTLEEGLLVDKADFFEEVYSIRPELKRKKVK